MDTNGHESETTSWEGEKEQTLVEFAREIQECSGPFYCDTTIEAIHRLAAAFIADEAERSDREAQLRYLRSERTEFANEMRAENERWRQACAKMRAEMEHQAAEANRWWGYVRECDLHPTDYEAFKARHG